jgi:hypothetical protein
MGWGRRERGTPPDDEVGQESPVAEPSEPVPPAEEPPAGEVSGPGGDDREPPAEVSGGSFTAATSAAADGFAERPEAFVGAAFVGGFVLAKIMKRLRR